MREKRLNRKGIYRDNEKRETETLKIKEKEGELQSNSICGHPWRTWSLVAPINYDGSEPKCLKDVLKLYNVQYFFF